MMWLARRKPLVAVAATLMLATVGVAVQGHQQPAPEGAREQARTAVPDSAANRALARQQLILIDQALAALHQMAQIARISPADPSFSLWGRRRLETLRKAGAGKAEIVAALEKYINTLKQDEAMAEARRMAAQGTQVDVYDVQFRRMEAEIWLNEEKAR
jgi:hypothetical protein